MALVVLVKLSSVRQPQKRFYLGQYKAVIDIARELSLAIVRHITTFCEVFFIALSHLHSQSLNYFYTILFKREKDLDIGAGPSWHIFQ